MRFAGVPVSVDALDDAQFGIPQVAADTGVAHVSHHVEVLRDLAPVGVGGLGGEFVVYDVGAAVGTEYLEIGNEADTRQPLPAIARSDEDSARIRAAGRGNDLHNILARMRTLDDLDHALAKVCDAAGAGDSVRRAYRALLSEAFGAGSEQAAAWFAPGLRVLAERTIYVGRDNCSSRRCGLWPAAVGACRLRCLSRVRRRRGCW